MKSKYVSYNGNLSVISSNLVNQFGKVFILKGISSHGIQWYGHLITEENLICLKSVFGINAFRIAMYTLEGGYIYDKNLILKVKEIIDLCIKLDLYVVVDYHILKDGNPLTYVNEAIGFFDEISMCYKDCPNVIYEICNEPNGSVTWANDIKLYSLEVIPIIRKNSPNAIIIVGTENYSQGIDKVVNDLLPFDNIMYSLHFYAATHKEKLRNKFIYAKNSGVPIIVSEFGVSDAETNSKLDFKEAQAWLSLLKENNISIFCWSLSDKNEVSSLLLPNDLNDFSLSLSGEFIRNAYNKY